MLRFGPFLGFDPTSFGTDLADGTKRADLRGSRRGIREALRQNHVDSGWLFTQGYSDLRVG
jgi:hypothetical protein